MQQLCTDGHDVGIASTYNEADSDVVLTTGRTTARPRLVPACSDVIIQSSVLELIYRALYEKSHDVDGSYDLGAYAILSNSSGASPAVASPADTTILHFSGVRPFDKTTGKFTFSPGQTLTTGEIDYIIDSITANTLRRNDTLDITVSGIDTNSSQVCSTTLVYSGEDHDASERREQHGSKFLDGLFGKHPVAQANKKAICLAISKDSHKRGGHVVSNRPFQFSYKRCGQGPLKILENVKLYFDQYYYMVYQFAPALQVLPLPIFSRPTKNRTALKDVFVLSGKYDAHVDLEFRLGDFSKYGYSPTGKATSLGIFSRLTVTYTPAAEVSDVTWDSPGRGKYQFFENESDLYSGRTADAERVVGHKMRLYLGKVPTAVTNIQIDAQFSVAYGNSEWSVTIPKTNIRNYLDSTANAGFVEMQYPGSSFIAERDTFNDDISQWDIQAGVKRVSNRMLSFENLLKGLKVFNQPIGCWNTTGITNMKSLFSNSNSFNQPIGAWNTSCVKTMHSTFSGASCFNQSLTNWNVQEVSTFDGMFNGATAFNGTLVDWKTSAAGASAIGMFEGAESFNRPFDTSAFRVTCSAKMFKGALSFNQVWYSLLSGYTDTSLNEMFSGAVSLSCAPDYTHDLPASCASADAMFEGASRWNGSVASTAACRLASVKRMYKGAKSFNRAVTLATSATNLDCTSIFEDASSMNSRVTISGAGTVTLDCAFHNAVSFNGDVNIPNRTIRSARSLFKCATAYGGYDAVDAFRPSFGAVSARSGACHVDFDTRNDGSGIAVDMFYGTRFNNAVSGHAPNDSSYMFAGAEHLNTPTKSGFFAGNVTSLEGAFKGAVTLSVNPIPDASGLKNVTNLQSMFQDATRFNADITQWGTFLPANANYSSMFQGATSFNRNLPSTWTQPACNIVDMFKHATSYTYGALKHVSTTLGHDFDDYSASSASRTLVRSSITVNATYDEVMSDAVRTNAFKTEVATAVSTATGVAATSVHISSIRSGSTIAEVVVSVEGKPSDEFVAHIVASICALKNVGPYTATAFAFPTGVQAVLSVSGTPTTNFAAGETYDASGRSVVMLYLKNFGRNDVQVAATGAVRVLVAGAPVDVDVHYTYRSTTHDLLVTKMTLGLQTGAIQFGVTLFAPSGVKSEVISPGDQHTVVALSGRVFYSICEIRESIADKVWD
jgi:hypothetical protein